MTTLLTIISGVLGGVVLTLLGVVVWQTRTRNPSVEPEPERDPPGLEEPTLPGPVPPIRDFLEEVTRDPPVPVPDDPDDPGADERHLDSSDATLDEWERVKGSLDL